MMRRYRPRRKCRPALRLMPCPGLPLPRALAGSVLDMQDEAIARGGRTIGTERAA
jgi:hypothetical protein